MTTKIGMLEKQLTSERENLKLFMKTRTQSQLGIDESMERIHKLRRRILDEEVHGDPDDYT